MRDLTSYQKVHLMVVRDINATLEANPLTWQNNSPKILDVGCGDGSIMMNIWRKHFPVNFTEIVGSDKSQNCVDFAKEHYPAERVQYMQLDIEGVVPKELKGNFDLIISSYVFHWVNQQETAFSNVFDMLSDDGSCLLIFLGYFKPYENYRTLSRTPKWSEHLKHQKTKFMSPYHDSQDAKKEIYTIMERIGFRNIDVKSEYKTFDYQGGVDDFRLLMKCLNPFDSLKDNWDEFMDDYIKLDPEAGTSVYQLLVVSGTK